jgi:hypothetical protein
MASWDAAQGAIPGIVIGLTLLVADVASHGTGFADDSSGGLAGEIVARRPQPLAASTTVHARRILELIFSMSYDPANS